MLLPGLLHRTEGLMADIRSVRLSRPHAALLRPLQTSPKLSQFGAEYEEEEIQFIFRYRGKLRRAA